MKSLCKNCLLPTDFLNINIDSEGVCQHCQNFEAGIKSSGHFWNLDEDNRKKEGETHLGAEVLMKDIQPALRLNKSKKYDCVVAFSGGRDSTYLLWYIVKVLKLRTLAVFVDDKFIPTFAYENVHKTCEILGCDLAHIEHDNLKKCIKHHLNAWIYRPVAATLLFVNVGERIGYMTMVEKQAVKEGVHLVFSGRTPNQDEAQYKVDSMKLNLKGGRVNWFMGYLKQVTLNPSLVTNLFCLKIQYKEFMINSWKEKYAKKHKLSVYYPFHNYIEWKVKEVERVLFEVVDWKLPEGTENTARIGCEIDTLRQYLYYRILGYNDINVDFSVLVRSGQLSKEEGLKKLKESQNIPEEYIRFILKKAGVDPDSFLKKLDEKYPQEK